ncbi:MAG: TonB-dependent receptor [bacterium]|nr:TonB-dependent receptor [bacterium]
MRLRTALTLFCLVAFTALPVLAQVSYSGSLFLEVTDEQGNAVAGATVKLTGPLRTQERTTSSAGQARFIDLSPAKYELEVGAKGHNTQVYPNIQIDTLANVSMTVKLQASTTVERVVVTAVTPLLDARRTGTATVLTQEEINQIPTARDPWAVLQTIPGVTSDRINVGGDQAGQQANFVGKGDDGEQSSWIMDGVDFTDNAAEGATQTYLDWNAFEQVSYVTAGGADIEQSTPGVRLNFVQKQGSNTHTGTARMLYTEIDLQANANRHDVKNPLTGDKQDVAGNGVTEIFEKNFDLGGPLWKDNIWYWFGFTQNDIDIFLANTGTQDVTALRNISIKAHGQVKGNTTWNAFWTEGDKSKDGRTAVPNRAVETTWVQSGPSPITSGRVSHFFSPNIEVSAQISKVEGGFALSPKGGSAPGTQIIVDESGAWTNTFIDFSTERPTDQYAVRGNWFFDGGGWNHELKFGFKYKETERGSTSLYGGDGVLAFEGPGGIGGSAYLYRIADFSDETTHLNVWAGNTMLKGPWAINYGVHWSSQDGEQSAGTVPGNPLEDDPAEGGIPELVFDGFDPGVKWDDLMPRVGATYTFDWERRLLLKASYARYTDALSNADIGFNNPIAASAIGYFWDDLDGDLLVSIPELDIDGGTIGTTNYDPNNPDSAESPDQINSNLDAPTVDELIIGAEWEVMRNFTVGANITYRERKDELFAPLFDVPEYDATGSLVTLGPEIYSCPTQSGGGAITYSEPVCLVTDTSRTTISRNVYLTNDGSLTQEYLGLELTATKRLSDRWMLRGFLAFANWEKEFSGVPVTNGTFDAPPSSRFVVPDGDPTNLAGDTTADGSDIAYQSGGSGPTTDIWAGSSRWQFNVNALYQLPWFGLTASGNLQAREGYAIPTFFTNQVQDADGKLTQKAVQIDTFGDDRYDDIFLLDLKLAKLFKLGGDTTLEIAAEMFNVFDDDTVLSVGRDANDVQSSVDDVNQLVSPQIARFSATINF